MIARKSRHTASFAAVLSATTLLLSSCTTDLGSGSQAARLTPGEVPNITASERQLGAKAHPELLQAYGGAYTGPGAQYIIDVGNRIALQSGLGESAGAFTVTVLDSPVNNAFAIPGGFVYVTRQLASLANDEAELAGVIGHEVGHVAARHSAARQSQAQRSAILGVLGQIAGGLLGGQGGALGSVGGLLQNYSGAVAQVMTLQYSRSQELDADDLGILYLNRAGYDATALARMLQSLAQQNALEARAADTAARSVPEWASTHPDPARRVNDALATARRYPAGGVTNTERFMNAVDGMLYGDSPKQGVIEGRTFLHPELRLRFTVPQGFAMQNSPSAVNITGTSGQAQFSTAPYDGNLPSYVAGVFSRLVGQGQSLPQGTVQRTTINGLPAAYSTARANTQQGQVDVTVFAYQFGSDRAYHFVAITQAGSNPFDSLYRSVAPLSAAQAAEIRPRRIDVVKVGSGDTVASLSRRMAFQTMQEERFRVLNGLAAGESPRVGSLVKIVVYGR